MVLPATSTRADVLRGESEYGGALAYLLGGVQGRCLTSEARPTGRPGDCGPLLAAPGVFWLLALFVVPFYAVMAVAFSGDHRHLRRADSGLEPARLAVRDVPGRVDGFDLRRLPGGLAAYRFYSLLGPADLRRGRLSGRVLHGPAWREAARPHPGPHPRPMVDQLHHPDAGLDQPVAGRRLRQRLPRLVRRRPVSMAVRATRSPS